MKCKQLKNMPSFVTDWQMFVVIPACEWYCGGNCSDKRRKKYNDPCEFERTGGVLPTQMVPYSPTRVEDAQAKG